MKYNSSFRFLLLFLFTGFSGHMWAQVSSVLQSVDSLAQLGEYKNAVQLTNDFLQTNPRNFAKSQAYFRLAKAHLALGDGTLAADYNKESLGIKEKIAYEYFADNIQLSGLIALAEGRPELALAYFADARTIPHESVRFSERLERDIGLAYLMMDSLQRAEQQFNQTLDLLYWDVGDSHPEVAVTQIALGRIESRKGNFWEALKQFRIAQVLLQNANAMQTAYGAVFYDAIIEWFLYQENIYPAENETSQNLRHFRNYLKPDEALWIHRANERYRCTFVSSQTAAAAFIEDYTRNAPVESEDRLGWNFKDLTKAAYAERAYQDYEFLMSPVSSVLDDVKQIMLVRYEELKDFPFEVLLREEVNPSAPYADFPFLGARNQFEYSNQLDSYFVTRLLSSRKIDHQVKMSKEISWWYRWKIKRRYKQFLKEEGTRQEALFQTRRWMMGHPKLAAPKYWLAIE